MVRNAEVNRAAVRAIDPKLDPCASRVVGPAASILLAAIAAMQEAVHARSITTNPGSYLGGDAGLTFPFAARFPP